MRSPTVRAVLVVAVALIIMCEQREAPLALIHGAVDPSPVSLRLKNTPMRGGVLELPAGIGPANYLYTLRAADHARPLVDGVSGFLPPIERAVEEMSNTEPVSLRFADLIEAIPVSYVVVHHALLSPGNERALQTFFQQGIAAGRFRLVERFGEAGDDLYVVTKTEKPAKQ